MGLWDKLKGELIDVIEWLDDTRDTMVYRFPRYENEIKMGAKLIVREGQSAIFVREGKVADVFGPGTFTLETQNLPILSTLAGWMHGFKSPFKAEVYFVATRQFTDIKWGTQNPIILRDAEFGAVRVRAFGTLAVRVVDPAAILRQLVGTDPLFKTDEVSGFLRQMTAARLAGALASAKVPVLDLAAHQDQIGAVLGKSLSAECKDLGVEFTRFVIENVSLPPEVEQALDKRTQMGIVGDMNRYTQFQGANAIEQAAKNPSGGGGGIADGMGLAAGMAMGQRMAQTLGGGGAAEAPPPLPSAATFYFAVGGDKVGPVDLARLRTEVAAGRLGPATLVWKPGLPNWIAAKDLPDTAALFPPTPPPLPS